MRSCSIYLVGLCLVISQPTVFGSGPTYISGSQSGTFYFTNSPYVATSDIGVPAGQTLTIEPGVEIQFTNANIGAFVDGTLIARGSIGSPILFTSDKPVKEPGQWRVLQFGGSSGTNCVLEQCIVECGGAANGGYTENIRVIGPGAPLITNCVIRLASGNGLTLFGADSRIQNCTFNSNTNSAIAMRADSLPVLRSNSASANGRNAIGIFGLFISRSGSWTRDNLPYTIYEEAQLNNGVTLTIEPGSVIQFERVSDGFYVDGTLVARGTPASPILFTSDEAVKQPGQWRVLDFRSTASTNSILENCIVECAAAPTAGYFANIQFEGAPSVLISNCTIRSSFAHGIIAYASDPRVFSCTFTNNGTTNGGFAIAMRTDCLPVLRNNAASGNGKNAIGIFGFYISRTGTWVRDNLPYTIYEEAQVNSGVTLTIEPGSVIQFERVSDGFYVDGTLVARGTKVNPIRFTSDEALKQPGQWRVLNFRSGASSNNVMENCIVECAGSVAGGYTENIRIESTAPILITNCMIVASTKNGLTLFASDPRIFNCTFTSNGPTNGGFALAMRTDCLPVLRNNFAFGNGKNSIGVFGYYISRSGTWVRDSLPYTIYEEAQVNSGVTLTIEPGTVIQFERPFDGFYVDGTLVARGTIPDPILFTSDDTVKQPGQWRVLNFRSTAGTGSVLENCIIEYGSSVAGGYSGSLQFEGAPPILVTNCTVRASTNDGIHCVASSPQVRNCRIINNRRDGVRTVNGATPIIAGSEISGNLAFGVNNLDTSKIINAQGNYWGDPTGPFDNSNVDGQGLTNPGGLGDKVSEYVNWSSVLGANPTSGDPPVYLAIDRSGDLAVVSWADSAGGYLLQTATHLPAAQNDWSIVTNTVLLLNGRYTIYDSLAAMPKFFRLIR